MNKIIQEQLQKLSKCSFKVDGVVTNTIPDTFSEIVFYQGNYQQEKEAFKDYECKVTFKPYFVKGYTGFDFHDRYNNGIAPKHYVMYGKILKETENMYKLQLGTVTDDYTWTGWCPKKSCTVEKLMLTT